MKIAVVGTGYVGLVTGTCFAECGNDVICIDKDEHKIHTLESGGIPIYEPGLSEMVQRNHKEGRLAFTTSLPEGIAPAQLIFIAVGTPQSDDGSADLSTVFAVADALGTHIDGPKIVVIKSTVPVGTNRRVGERIAARCAHPVDMVSNPEFLKEGAAIEDCLKPDRVVVGVRRPEIGEVLRELYAPFLRTERPFLVMSPESAEMTKYAANAMLATKISYINEMANLCEKVGADINDVRRGIGHDARIGFQFLFPGAGYGGSCFEGDETVFTVDAPGALTATSLAGLFERVARKAGVPAQDELATCVSAPGGYEEASGGLHARRAERLPPRRDEPGGSLGEEAGLALEPPADERLQVVAFDLESRSATHADVRVVTRRPYQGTMVTIRTSMGRCLRVTADHPVVLHVGDGFQVVPADKVCAGDRIPAFPQISELLTDLPSGDTVDLSMLGRFTTLTVREVIHEHATMPVYSLETSTGTVIASSGLIAHNCFPKDIRAIVHMSKEFASPTPLMRSVDDVNEAQKQVLVAKVKEHYGPSLREKTLAIWGLAFKPRTDDIREAPSLVLIDALLAAGVKLRVHDPEAMENVRAIHGDKLVYCDRPYGALEGADGLVIVTEWQQFRNPDFELMRRLMTEAAIFDGRNLYEPGLMAEAGFAYHSIGRQAVRPIK